MENPIKMDDLGDTIIFGNIQVLVLCLLFFVVKKLWFVSAEVGKCLAPVPPQMGRATHGLPPRSYEPVENTGCVAGFGPEEEEESYDDDDDDDDDDDEDEVATI